MDEHPPITTLEVFLFGMLMLTLGICIGLAGAMIGGKL